MDDDYEATDYPIPPDFEDHVQTDAFDQQCVADFRKTRPKNPDPDDSDPESVRAFWSPVTPNSSFSSVESSPHDPPRLEAKYYYYFGYSSDGRVSCPKLVYRTSKDIWVPPTGAYTYPREMKLCNIAGDHELAKNPTLWDPLRNQVVELLTARNCQLSSVELVSFTWLEEKEDDDDEKEGEDDDDDDGKGEDDDEDDDDGKGEDDDDGKGEDDDDDDDGKGEDDDDALAAAFDSMTPVQDVEEGRYTTPPTIWVGVLPTTLSGAAAYDLANEILKIVSQYNLTGVDVAFRESKAQLLSRPALFGPVDDDDHLKSVIDNLSTVLPLPIAGRKTSMQGTLTCFFRIGKELYAITARHNLFKDGKDDQEYTFKASAPRKDVIVMGPDAFTKYLAFIRTKIGNITDTMSYLAMREERLKQKVEVDTDDTDSAEKLAKTRQELAGYEAQKTALKAFYMKVGKRWSKVEDRIIGYVAWAPKIDLGVSPYGYTRDFCVIHIDKKERFKEDFLGNTLSLGPETTPADFTRLMYDRDDAPSEFKYPQRGLLEVKDMLTANEINAPNAQDVVGDPMRRVFKRGMTTKTTVGTLLPFKAHVRRYLSTGPRDSVEVTVIPHRDVPGPFSRGGDSGALIVDALSKYVALLTGGSGMGNADLFDVTYGTHFKWVWDIVKAKFPGADLYFGNVENFFNDKD